MVKARYFSLLIGVVILGSPACKKMEEAEEVQSELGKANPNRRSSKEAADKSIQEKELPKNMYELLEQNGGEPKPNPKKRKTYVVGPRVEKNKSKSSQEKPLPPTSE